MFVRYDSYTLISTLIQRYGFQLFSFVPSIKSGTNKNYWEYTSENVYSPETVIQSGIIEMGSTGHELTFCSRKT